MINEFEDFLWLHDATVDDRIVIEHSNKEYALSIVVEHSFYSKGDDGKIHHHRTPQRIKLNCGIIKWDMSLPLYVEEFYEWDEFNSFLKCFLDSPKDLVATLVSDFITNFDSDFNL